MSNVSATPVSSRLTQCFSYAFLAVEMSISRSVASIRGLMGRSRMSRKSSGEPLSMVSIATPRLDACCVALSRLGLSECPVLIVRHGRVSAR